MGDFEKRVNAINGRFIGIMDAQNSIRKARILIACGDRPSGTTLSFLEDGCIKLCTNGPLSDMGKDDLVATLGKIFGPVVVVTIQKHTGSYNPIEVKFFQQETELATYSTLYEQHLSEEDDE